VCRCWSQRNLKWGVGVLLCFLKKSYYHYSFRKYWVLGGLREGPALFKSKSVCLSFNLESGQMRLMRTLMSL
jgi:hypothetical protein